jgi:hypothetical protein
MPQVKLKYHLPQVWVGCGFEVQCGGLP